MCQILVLAAVVQKLVRRISQRKVEPFFAEAGLCFKKSKWLEPVDLPGAPADSEKFMEFLARLKDTKRKRNRNFGRGLQV